MLSSDLKMFSDFDVRTDTGKEFHSGMAREKKVFITVFIWTEVLVRQWQGSACLGIEQLQWGVLDVNIYQLVDYFVH